MAILAVYPQGSTLHVAAGAPEAFQTASIRLSSYSVEAAISSGVIPWLESVGITQDSVDFVVTSGSAPESPPTGIQPWDPPQGQGAQQEGFGSELFELLAARLAKPIYLIDPASRGECHAQALVTGTPAIQRTCLADYFIFKYLARQEAHRRGLPLSEGGFIAAHLGEINQLGALVGTRVVDCITSADEGPFALSQSGSLPFDGLLELCGTAEDREAVLTTIEDEGGLKGYLGLESVTELFSIQNEQSELIRHALIYQTAKEIGAFAAVLEGRVDAVILSGELAGVKAFVDELQKRVGFIAPVSAVPGNQAAAALMDGARRILS